MRVWLLIGIGLWVLAGCSSSKEVITHPPVAAPTESAPEDVTEISVVLEKGKSDLPREVETLTFSLTALEIRGVDQHIRWPLGHRVIRIAKGKPLSIPLLTTTLPVASYDTLRLYLSDAQVRFSANAGGPLTSDVGSMLSIPLSLTLQSEQPVTLTLRFEPEPSLWRDTQCTWHFVPFFLIETRTTTSSATH